MKSKDAVVAVISDMQTGSTVALSPLRWNLLDGGTYRASPGQKIIYRQWVKSAQKVKELRHDGRGTKRLVFVLNGEPIDGHHHDTPQLITTRPKEQIEMSISLIDEWLGIAEYNPKRGDCIYLVRGTSAHERGEYIEQIGRDFDGVVPYRKDTSPLVKDGRYHFQKLRRTVNGVLFDFAHHGFTRGSRAWTRSNSIRYALQSIYFNALENNLPIPDYVIRSHKHYYTYDDYKGERKTVWGCLTPCWQLKTYFGNMVAANDPLNTIGMIYFDVLKNGNSKPYAEYIKIEDAPVKEF